jgi:hypothetical protein
MKPKGIQDNFQRRLPLLFEYNLMEMGKTFRKIRQQIRCNLSSVPLSPGNACN